jgi:TM2 domain-containing membrane protein YozV
MKKLVLALALVIGAAGASFASNYKLDEAAVESAFTASDDITLSVTESLGVEAVAAEGELSKTQYLIRAWFCGSFALHRSYMGTGGKGLLLYYLCIPVANYVAIMVDFWGVIIKGDEFWMKYKDNPKFFAWNN